MAVGPASSELPRPGPLGPSVTSSATNGTLVTSRPSAPALTAPCRSRAPRVLFQLVPEPKTVPPAVGPMPAWNAPHAAARPKKVPIVPIAIAAALVVIVVGTGVWAMRSRASAAPQRPQLPSAAAKSAADDDDDPATAKTESCFSTFSLLQ